MRQKAETSVALSEPGSVVLAGLTLSLEAVKAHFFNSGRVAANGAVVPSPHARDGVEREGPRVTKCWRTAQGRRRGGQQQGARAEAARGHDTWLRCKVKQFIQGAPKLAVLAVSEDGLGAPSINGSTLHRSHLALSSRCTRIFL